LIREELQDRGGGGEIKNKLVQKARGRKVFQKRKVERLFPLLETFHKTINHAQNRARRR
jgi:hypothetical protein